MNLLWKRVLCNHGRVSLSPTQSKRACPLKLAPAERMRVSYIGITSAFQADERGSTPLTRSTKIKMPFCGYFNFSSSEVGGEREGGRGNGSFPVAEVLKPMGFNESRATCGESNRTKSRDDVRLPLPTQRTKHPFLLMGVLFSGKARELLRVRKIIEKSCARRMLYSSSPPATMKPRNFL